MWLNNRTEYSFGATYAPIQDVINTNAGYNNVAGIMDDNGTWGFCAWEQGCKAAGVKPVFGIRLAVSEDPGKNRRYPYNAMGFIAKNQNGLRALYRLTEHATRDFYWRPRISYDLLNQIDTDDVAILSGVSPQLNKIHIDILLELSPGTPKAIRKIKSIPPIACLDNYIVDASHFGTYNSMQYHYGLQTKTTPIHIISPEEWLNLYPKSEIALENLIALGKDCDVELIKAEMITLPGNSEKRIKSLVWAGAKRLGINLKKSGPYRDRYEREINLIIDKDYVDYFLVVSDLVYFAKNKMGVGPGRGSSGGSLVCYCLGITAVDPIKYGLLFERFIDPNRTDLPDIDIDFADTRRGLAVKYLENKYGERNVAQLGNISRLKPRSALVRFSKSLRVPTEHCDDVKEIVQGRPPGDARANYCLFDAYQTETGKNFTQRHPGMSSAADVEGHCSHTSVHAAGVVVSTQSITNYCGVNARDKKRIAMVDKRDAEYLNLLKIDVLGLRTLSILGDACEQIGRDVNWLNSIPHNDKKAYTIFSRMRTTGVFQFEGDAVRRLAGKSKIKDIEDLAAITSIARPGPMMSGGAERYVARRSGDSEIEYLTDHPDFVRQVEPTCGIIIYQEQLLNIGREYGRMDWASVGKMRKAMSKSMGQEAMEVFHKPFISGATGNGDSRENAEKVWLELLEFGLYGFNKSHAVAYSIISYQCAYLKAHYPLEFATACMNHVKDDNQAVKLLRDMAETENIKCLQPSAELSGVRWTTSKGALIPALTTIKGIGVISARKIVKLRDEGETIPPGLQKHLNNMDCAFNTIYPANDWFRDFYLNPEKYIEDVTIEEIRDLQKGPCSFLGKLISFKVKDANSPENVAKRDGELVDGPSQYLVFVIEDDSDSITCIINRKNFSELSSEILNAEKDKDWFLILGEFSDVCFVNATAKITGEMKNEKTENPRG